MNPEKSSVAMAGTAIMGRLVDSPLMSYQALGGFGPDRNLERYPWEVFGVCLSKYSSGSETRSLLFALNVGVSSARAFFFEGTPVLNSSIFLGASKSYSEGCTFSA